MSFKHYPTDEFIKQAKGIKKVYPSFGNDLKQMRRDIDKLSSFRNQPHIDDLGRGIFKYRLEITDKPASKSYGARIIFFFLNEENELWYLTCYDKSDSSDLSPSEKKEIKKIIDEIKVTSPEDNRLRSFGSKKLSRKRSSSRSKSRGRNK
jgi:hypothetical protein